MDLIEIHTKRQTQLLSFFANYFSQTNSEFKKQKIQLIDYKHKANYWETRFKELKQRESEKNNEIEELKAKLKKREHHLFGPKSEKGMCKSESQKSNTLDTKKKRGQQASNKGPQRRDYSDLPSTEELIDLLENEKCCPSCHLPYEELPGTENSDIIEVINVQAYQRKIRRKMYKRGCQCSQTPQMITAPVPDKLIPKSRFGNSIWVYLLIQKYKYQRPQHNTLQELANHGLDLRK